MKYIFILLVLTSFSCKKKCFECQKIGAEKTYVFDAAGNQDTSYEVKTQSKFEDCDLKKDTVYEESDYDSSQFLVRYTISNVVCREK